MRICVNHLAGGEVNLSKEEEPLFRYFHYLFYFFKRAGFNFAIVTVFSFKDKNVKQNLLFSIQENNKKILNFIVPPKKKKTIKHKKTYREIYFCGYL